MTKTLVGETPTVKKPAKVRTPKKAATAKTAEVATMVVPQEQSQKSPAELAVSSLTIQLPKMEPVTTEEIVTETSSAYKGPLPIHEGKPVFIERNAWGFYMNPNAYGVRHERIRNYLMQQDAFALAEAMGRPLTVEDLKILVQLDGEKEVECYASGRRFRPLNWTLILPVVLEKLREGKTLVELEQDNELLAVGHFIYNNGNIIALGGSPYHWKEGFDNDQLNFLSPVTKWRNKTRQWPNTFGQVSRMNDARVARREERTVVDNKIGSLLDEWNPGANRQHHRGKKQHAYHH